LLPPTSVKLSICQVMTVVNRSPAGRSLRHSSRVTGCHVLRQVKSPTGTGDAFVPMFDPKVNSRSNRWKNATYHGSAFAIASCVNAGSESMNALRGMRAYSSRQNHEPPERFRKRSASAQ
jgi:hypothetical protein